MKNMLLLATCVFVLTACQSEKHNALVASHETAKPAPPVLTTPSSVDTAITPPAVDALPATVKSKPKSELTETEAIALAKKQKCFGCHMIKMKIVGPDWMDVAARYRADAGAQTRLVNIIAKGGSGVWGNVAMPAQTQIGEEERTGLVRFILNLK